MTDRRKVAHLSSYHPPFDTRVFHREARSVADAGYETVLVAPADADADSGGVKLRAIPRRPGRAAILTHTVWDVWRAARRERPDICHFHDPELIPVGLLLKLGGRRVIYDVHEDVPRQLRTWYWIPRWLRTPMALAAAAMEKIAGWCLDAVVAATPTIAAKFPARKTITVQNFPAPDELMSPEAGPYADRPPLAAYAGGLSDIRGVREMVAAMELVPASLEARLALAGHAFVPATLEAEVRAMPGWQRVDFVGWQSRDQLRDLLGRSRLGLVVLHPTANHLDAWPLKMFEYMAAGLPVVASDFPLWREILDDINCALFVDPLDPRAVAGAVERLLSDPAEAEAMGRRGRQAVLDRYNWQGEARKLLDLYCRLLAR